MAFCAWCGNQVPQVAYVACPRCGNLTNGAQRAAGGNNNSSSAVMVLVLLVGGLVAVAVVGILAAIAIPNFLTAKTRAMQKRTMADIRSVASSVEAYATDKNRYPQASEVQGLTSELQPTYARELPTVDAWGTPLRYRSFENNYMIASAGADKAFEHESIGDYAGGKTGSFDCDIVFANGTFVQYPEGAVSTTEGQ